MHSLTPALPLSEQGLEDLTKVLRVNQRWIVHGTLRDHTAAYLDHLQATDPARLEKACALALALVHQPDRPPRDPKPLFYAGLFAPASREEIATFLDEHLLTRAVSLLLHGDPRGKDSLSPPARQLAETLAAEIRLLLAGVS